MNKYILTAFIMLIFVPLKLSAQEKDQNLNKDQYDVVIEYQDTINSFISRTDSLVQTKDSTTIVSSVAEFNNKKSKPVSIYALPYSSTKNSYDWRRLWTNTAVLTSAFVGSLLVLECLPEDATSWNRAALQEVPLFKRWKQHVIEEGPEWDHDKFYFNYLLHPYAGAAYFMAARSCGFNFWRSLLYSSIISNVGWEYGIEAFMERPSYQDLFITPIVGSFIGEGFYKIKRHLVNNGYELLGSTFLGGFIAWLVDPVNEFTGLWLGNPARKIAKENRLVRKGTQFSFIPQISQTTKGFSIIGYF